ncbi:MAG: tetratricopeptide repeat protein [Polyangiaceae bacterium]
MLKVECESCKAPYQIDERRVPAAGLKMRCPKCGHSFVVKNSGVAAGPAPTAAPPRVVPRGPEAAPPKPAPPAPPAPPAKPPPPAPKPSLPMALMSGDLDLSPPSADLPAPVPPRAAAGPVIQKRAPAGTIIGIPGPRVVKVGGVTPAAPATKIDKIDDFDLGLDDDLPALPGDLPAVAAPKAPKPPVPQAPKAPPLPQPTADLPAAKRFNKTVAFGPGAKPDLPSLAEADLPAVASHADLPSPVNVGLPAARADLPSPALTDLPSPANVGLPAAAKVGLPSPAKVGSPPAVRGAPPPVPGAKRPAPAFGEIDLPIVANDLPAVASALPSVASSLPSVAGSLPAVASALPSVASSLPSVAGSLPAVANALPSVANALPSVQSTSQQLPSSVSGAPAFGVGDDFGELELPRAPNNPPAAAAGGSLFDENPFTSVAPPGQSAASGGDDGGFGELELPVAPENRPASFPPPGGPHSEPGQTGAAGGMSFGELDLGGAGESQAPIGGGEYGEASLGSVIQPPPSAPSDVSRVSQLGQLPGSDGRSSADAFAGPSEASIDAPARPRRERAAERSRGPSPLPKILAGLVGVAVLGGAALTLTPYGPFGYYAVQDAAHKAEYAKAATDALQKLHDGLKTDVYSDSVNTANQLAAARAARPRARSLTAIAAIAEIETELRFGKEPERANRAKVWLTSEIPEPRANVRYLDVANAAVAAIDRERDKARAGFDAAERKYAGDPILLDIAFMRGQFELRTGDGAAATAAFQKALALAPGGRAHFGLAQAAYLTGDVATATKELGETITASPKNGAALSLRAELAWGQGHDDAAANAALKDIATLLEGPARDSISTEQQAQTYALRGEIQFARGRSAEARAAYEDALKVDARNVAALIGQGDVYYDEGRNTEAVGRYETAKQVNADAIRAIVGHAKTLIRLERLADAKTELTDAVKRFPKSSLAMQWLAESEATLGNKKDAEKDFLAAIDLADPKDPDAVDAYAAYATFLSRQGRADEAQAKLKDALKKLPDTAALERSLGDVAEEQGLHDEAISRYKLALEKDPQDVTSRFHLGQALRRANRGDEATKTFDLVFQADKNYPNLALERGLLLEQSGKVDEALAQFSAALEKHPDDPDLLLRVGAALVAIGKPDDAIVKLKKVLQQRPNSADAEHYLGRALMLKGGVFQQEAMRRLRTAVEKDQNRAEYHLYVGWLANDLTPPDLGLADKEIHKALELDNTLADGYWQRGVLEHKTSADDDAAKDLKYAIQLKPTLYQAHASLAQVYERKNMPDQAIAEWNIAFARDDSNDYWNYLFGKLLLDRGSVAEAAKHLKASADAGEQEQPRPGWLTSAEFQAAEALRRMGDKAGAIKHYTSFLQHADLNDPNNRDARSALVQLGAPYEDQR